MKEFNLALQSGRHLYSFIISLLAFVLLAGMVSEIFAADLIRVRIKQKVQINDENILLGRIAKIDGIDPIKVQKLSGIVVGRAPLPGNSRELKESIFKMRLKQNGIDLSELVLHIPPKVVVTRGFIEISPDKIKMLISDYILKNIFTGRDDAGIKDIRVAEGLRLPDGRITYKVIPPRNRDMMGKIPFSVNFDVNGKFHKRVWATATIEVLAKVVVTRKPLGRHKPITEDDIELQKMDLAGLPSGVITDPEAVLGKRTRRAIGAKTVLRANLIEFPPLVKRGDVVVIIAESNGLKITALGQVKKRGRLGERIPVINFDSKKIFYARVLNSNTVKVEF